MTVNTRNPDYKSSDRSLHKDSQTPPSFRQPLNLISKLPTNIILNVIIPEWHDLSVDLPTVHPSEECLNPIVIHKLGIYAAIYYAVFGKVFPEIVE
jgi:hypothetical protein